MAFENMTYEVILKRMIGRVSTDYPSLDTREGSILFNALAPAAMELAIMYTELDNAINESFVETATREYLLLKCEEMGMDISIFNANFGTHKAQFDVEVEIGSRWNCELYNYEVTEYLGLENALFTYRVVCETAGTAPNTVVGDLTAITNSPQGLTIAKLVECVIEGENETSDEDVRLAYYDYVNTVATDGNINQYKRWCSSYDGIGNYKIFPLWNGDNTVKVSILSATNKTASDDLVAEFQEYLDPGVNGMGDGVAPIGSFVTVSTATEVKLNITANIALKSGYTNTSPQIDKSLTDYFANIAYTSNVVPYMSVGAAILSTEGVAFISDLKINGGTSDIDLGDEEIPVLGETDWTVT